jgi:hypothetical protein
MVQMVIDTEELAVESYLSVKVHIEAEVLTAEKARRKANVWLLMNVGNLLGAENPELIFSDSHLLWRVDVILTSPTRGKIGQVGRLWLDAVTGNIVSSALSPLCLSVPTNFLTGKPTRDTSFW